MTDKSDALPLPQHVVDLALVRIVPVFERRRPEIQQGVKATFRGKEIGVMDFHSTGNRLDVAYLKVYPRFQGQGIATVLLEWLRDNIPGEPTYIGFLNMTSGGVARLVERVFGPLRSMDYHVDEQTDAAFRWDMMPDDSPQANLQYARGPHGYVEWHGHVPKASPGA
jgi:hypothetical protein